MYPLFYTYIVVRSILILTLLLDLSSYYLCCKIYSHTYTFMRSILKLSILKLYCCYIYSHTISVFRSILILTPVFDLSSHLHCSFFRDTYIVLKPIVILTLLLDVSFILHLHCCKIYPLFYTYMLLGLLSYFRCC